MKIEKFEISTDFISFNKLMRDKINELVEAVNQISIDNSELARGILNAHKRIDDIEDQNNEELQVLRCPFCNGKCEIDIDMERHAEEYFVKCVGKNCKVSPITDYFDSPYEAIRAWNTRA